MDLHNTSNDSTLNYSSTNISTSIDSISIDLGLGSNDSNSKDSSNQISNAQTLSKLDTDKLLPVVLLANVQSFGKTDKTGKTSELELVLQLNNVQVGVFTETWLNDITSQQLQFNSYSMFHSVRTNTKRASGGVSVFVMDDIPATKLSINIPEHLEVMYVSIRPKWLPRSISNIVVCAVYYPGSTSKYAPPQEDLILHLNETIHKFYVKYANPQILLLGDFNDLKVNEICESCKLKQVVKVPTRKEAILDLIMLNEDNNMYNEPITLPSIGKSDHLCVLLRPINQKNKKIIKEKIMMRKFKKSAIILFGAWLTKFDWSKMFKLQNVNDKVAYFSTITWLMVEKYFPLRLVKISNTDKEWMTPKLKNLISKRQKAHKSNNHDLRDYLAKK